MEKQFRCIQFCEQLIASCSQFRAMINEWHKRKKSLRAILRNGIPVGNPTWYTKIVLKLNLKSNNLRTQRCPGYSILIVSHAIFPPLVDLTS